MDRIEFSAKSSYVEVIQRELVTTSLVVFFLETTVQLPNSRTLDRVVVFCSDEPPRQGRLRATNDPAVWRIEIHQPSAAFAGFEPFVHHIDRVTGYADVDANEFVTEFFIQLDPAGPTRGTPISESKAG